MSRNAGNVDDAAFTLFLHCGAKYLAGEDSASDQIHVKTFPPIGGANLLEGMFGSDGHPWIVAARGRVVMIHDP